MPQTASGLRFTPAMQAAAVLRAWAQENRALLHEEVEKILELRGLGDAQGADEEHLELLKAVAENLNARARAGGAASGDPAVRVCVTLLEHLAGRP